MRSNRQQKNLNLAGLRVFHEIKKKSQVVTHRTRPGASQFALQFMRPQRSVFGIGGQLCQRLPDFGK